jgi:hypothetical protein
MKKDWKVTLTYTDPDSGDEFEDFLIIRATYCSRLDHSMIQVEEAQITFNQGWVEKVEEYNEE